MHIGIPVTNKKPGMVYNEDMKLWMSNPEDYDYVIEYLKFEEGTPCLLYTSLACSFREGDERGF